MRYTVFLSMSSIIASSLVSAHCLIPNAVGDQGGKAAAFGVKTATDNNQGDVTVFAKGGGAFGKVGGADVDPAKDIAALLKVSGNTIPQVKSVLNVTLHQINGDGAGPMACSIDVAGKGTFADLTITTNVPGNNGRSNANNQDFPLIVEIPAATVCTAVLGTITNACLVKCQNPAGPFGGVIPIQIAGAGGAAAAGGKAKGAKAGRWVKVDY